MGNLILTTKGEIKYKLLFILYAIGMVALGMVAFFIAVETSNTEMKNVGIIACGVMVAIGFFAFMYSMIQCSGYIAIYDDHCEGKAIQGKGVKQFYLTNNQIRTATSESYFLCLHTDIGELKIICSKRYHMQALAHFAQKSSHIL